MRPNTQPGLGITINEKVVKQHPFQQELPQRVFHRDGAVGDWEERRRGNSRDAQLEPARVRPC